VRVDLDRTAQSDQLIRVLCAWHIAATPKNVVGSFRRAGLAVRWNGEQDTLFGGIVPAAADRVQEVFVHEFADSETEDDVASEDDLDDLPVETGQEGGFG
jgi:hypothetical protein